MKTKYLLENNLPFSQRLNDFITSFYNARKNTFVFTDSDDFNPENIEETFNNHKKKYRETQKINIWNGASDKTIFGSSEINTFFRAWHDFIHINYNLGYSQTEEAIVCNIQCDMLPNDWIFEKELIRAEIIGQAHYNYKNNTFVKNQRLFTCLYLEDSIKALNTKHL